MIKTYFSILVFISLTGFVATGQTPSFIWAKQGITAPAANNVTANMVTDTAGNSYVGGVFSGDSIRFGSFLLTLPAGSSQCLYVVKYDPQGNVLWAQQCYGLTFSQCNALALDAATGKLYITALYGTSGSGNFGFYNFSTCSNCSFAAQLDAVTGDVGWVSSLSDNNNSVELYAFGIAVSANRVYITGEYGPDDNNIFLAEYDINGNQLWVKPGTGLNNAPYSTYSNAVITDMAGNPYIAGIFTGGLVLGNDTLTNGANSIFLAKFDTLGNLLWVQNTTGSGNRAITDMATDGDGNIYLTGYFAGTLFFPPSPVYITNIGGNYVGFVVKYDTNGITIWVNTVGDGQSPAITTDAAAITVDAANNFYLTGAFNYQLRIGHDTLTPYGNSDIFIAKYDSMGNALWAKSAGGNRNDYGTGIGVDAYGNEYITGYFQSDTSYYDGITLYTKGGWDILIAKLGGPEVPVVNFKAGKTVVCSGSPVTFTNLSTGLPFTALNWTFNGGTPGASTAQNPAVVYNASGTYAVKLVVSNTAGMDSLTKTSYITVLPSPDPVVSATDSMICSGDSTQVCTVDTFVSYLWNTGATSFCTTAEAAGGYWVTVTDANHCSAVSGHQDISVYPVPSVSITVQGDTLSSFGAVSYQWLFDDSIISGATSPAYVAHKTGNYAVQVTDSNGCTALSAYTNVTVTGITNLQTDKVSIYPNPSAGSWQLMAGSDWIGCQLNIYASDGRLILNSIIKNTNTEINFEAPNGVYLLQIISPSATITYKLIRL